MDMNKFLSIIGILLVIIILYSVFNIIISKQNKSIIEKLDESKIQIEQFCLEQGEGIFNITNNFRCKVVHCYYFNTNHMCLKVNDITSG
jgi:hypothetical protein